MRFAVARLKRCGSSVGGFQATEPAGAEVANGTSRACPFGLWARLSVGLERDRVKPKFGT